MIIQIAAQEQGTRAGSPELDCCCDRGSPPWWRLRGYPQERRDLVQADQQTLSWLGQEDPRERH